MSKYANDWCVEVSTIEKISDPTKMTPNAAIRSGIARSRVRRAIRATTTNTNGQRTNTWPCTDSDQKCCRGLGMTSSRAY